MLWIFILGLLLICQLSRHDSLERVDYTALFPQPTQHGELANKKLMVLGDELSLYQKNKLAGYFLNWELSQSYFENPDYF